MRHLNKLASVFCAAALGLLVLTACEGGDLYNMDSPDWISEKIDSISNSKTGDVVTLSPTTLGATDCSDAWWGSHLDSDILLESQKIYTIGFTNHTSGANNWNNWVVVLRSQDKATEYAVMRADNYGWSNDQWTYSVTASTNASDDWAAWLAAMNGAHCTAVITNYGDNTADVVVTMEGTDDKTYVQSYTGISVNSSDLYLDFTTDGCYYVFDSEVVQVESAVDQQPVSMELLNVPSQVNVGTTLEEFISGIKAKVTYDGGTTKELSSSDLDFIVVPDLETAGDKYVVATLSKTYFGKAATATINAHAAFKVVTTVKELEVTKKPDVTDYTYIKSANGLTADELSFLSSGIEVTATYDDGTKGVLENEYLTFSNVPAKNGVQKVTITSENGTQTTVDVNVKEVTATDITMTPSVLGAEDCSNGWWTAFTDDKNVPSGETYAISFTNYSSGASNWNNFVVILRKADLTEYAVVRADNYGWGGTGYNNVASGGTQGDWATWLAAMNGAKVTVYVSNNGDGTANVYAVMKGTDGKTYTQYYYGIDVDPTDLNVSFTVDGSCLKFDSASAAKKHGRR